MACASGQTEGVRPAKALDQVLEAFWDQGYEAASVQGLCSAMGINRGSLYDTFGDKETLFTACMDGRGCFMTNTTLGS